MCRWNKKIIPVIIIALAACSEAAFAAHVYKSEGKRDPFVPLIGVVAASSGTDLASIISIEDVCLQGIVVGAGGKKMAVINGEILKEGDKVGNLSIISVKASEVMVEFNEKEHKLVLYE